MVVIRGALNMSIEDKFFIHLFIKNIITENILSNISKIVNFLIVKSTT